MQMITNKYNIEGKLSAKQLLSGNLNNAIEIEYPDLEDIEITPTTEDQNFKSKEYGYNNIKVKGFKANLQDKIVTKNGEYTADDGYDGLGKVSVETSGVDIYDYFSKEAESTSRAYHLILVVPELDTSEKKNMNDFFNGLTRIKTIPSIDTSKVTSAYGLFDGCNSLETIPELDLSQNTSFYRMFRDCMALKQVPMFDMSKNKTMNQMFYNCTSLENVPTFNTSNVMFMSEVFFRCSKLKELPLFDTSKATKMSAMLSGCSELETIPEINTENVTDMASIFSNCTKLKSVPQLNTSKVTTIQTAFASCLNLIDVPEFDLSSATNMQNMFFQCNSLSDESLNNILNTCITATKLSNSNKSLKYLGISSNQAEKCTTLSNYQSFLDAGWVTGY